MGRYYSYPNVNYDDQDSIENAIDEAYKEGFDDGKAEAMEAIEDEYPSRLMEKRHVINGKSVSVWVPTIQDNVEAIQKDGKMVSIGLKHGFSPIFEDQYGKFTFDGVYVGSHCGDF